MKKVAIIFVIVLAFIFGTLCNFHASANGTDEFTSVTLNHGEAFDHSDFFANVGSCNPECLIVPLTHFEPGFLRLAGANAGIEINDAAVVTVPVRDLQTIPEATTENQVEVVNQIRRVLIDSKLAAGPEAKARSTQGPELATKTHHRRFASQGGAVNRDSGR